MLQYWNGLEPRARGGLAAGALLIALMVTALGWWAYRPDYQVLFADLKGADAAAMVADLEKAKTPYQLAADGTTILVPRELVYRTRLKLMGRDLPLQGAVGFEVFNNADFGMSDFVQKVNYQRAVQGELTRTIQSIDDVQSARVHLALPEQGLFKRAAAKAKASVTVAMKPGRVLGADQVLGIQRLVAASVADVAAADVTVLDQHGVALSRAADDDAAAGGQLARLDSKRAAEEYLTRKVMQVLDHAFGPGEAIASVDVVQNQALRQVRTEEVLPSVHAASAAAAGVVVRERHTAQGDEATDGAKAPAHAQTSESEYQVGHRSEDLTVPAGEVTHVSVGVVVKKSLNADQLAELKQVLTQAAGLAPDRGDSLVVTTLDAVRGPAFAPPEPAPAAEPPAIAAAPVSRAPLVPWILGGLVLVVVLAAVALRPRRAVPAPAPAPRLTLAERERLAGDLQAWLHQDSGGATP